MYQMRVKKNFIAFKSIRRRDMNMTPRTAMINEIFHRDFKIDELNRNKRFLVTMSIILKYISENQKTP